MLGYGDVGLPTGTPLASRPWEDTEAIEERAIDELAPLGSIPRDLDERRVELLEGPNIISHSIPEKPERLASVCDRRWRRRTLKLRNLRLKFLDASLQLLMTTAMKTVIVLTTVFAASTFASAAEWSTTIAFLGADGSVQRYAVRKVGRAYESGRYGTIFISLGDQLTFFKR